MSPCCSKHDAQAAWRIDRMNAGARQAERRPFACDLLRASPRPGNRPRSPPWSGEVQLQHGRHMPTARGRCEHALGYRVGRERDENAELCEPGGDARCRREASAHQRRPTRRVLLRRAATRAAKVGANGQRRPESRAGLRSQRSMSRPLLRRVAAESRRGAHGPPSRRLSRHSRQTGAESCQCEPIPWTERALRDVAEGTQRHECDDEPPQSERVDGAKRVDGAVREEREDHDRRYAKQQGIPQLELTQHRAHRGMQRRPKREERGDA